MALGTPAWAAGSATIPTRVLRHLPAALTGVPVISHANSATATTRGGGYGVAAGGDLLVTTTGALGYSVAAGHFSLPGTSATGQGTYVGYNDAAVTGTLPARNATNPYIAYICVQVRDTDEDATGFEDATIAVIQGTPAATPAAPAVPSSLGSLLILSEVLVPSAANGGPVVFTERRMYLNAIGGVQRFTSSNRPTGAALWQGIEGSELDTFSRLWYDSTTWRYRYKPEVSHTPTSSTFTVTGGTFVAGYSIIQNHVRFSGRFIVGAGTSLAGGVTISMPVAASSLLSRRPGVAVMYDVSANQEWSAACQIVGGGSVLTIENVQGATNSVTISNTVPFTWAIGDEFWWDITYPAA